MDFKCLFFAIRACKKVDNKMSCPEEQPWHDVRTVPLFPQLFGSFSICRLTTTSIYFYFFYHYYKTNSGKLNVAKTGREKKMKYNIKHNRLRTLVNTPSNIDHSNGMPAIAHISFKWGEKKTTWLHWEGAESRKTWAWKLESHFVWRHLFIRAMLTLILRGFTTTRLEA